MISAAGCAFARQRLAIGLSRSVAQPVVFAGRCRPSQTRGFGIGASQAQRGDQTPSQEELERRIDEAEQRWGKRFRHHSPGGDTPVAMWREASRMGRTQEVNGAEVAYAALEAGVPGGDTILGFGKYRLLTYDATIREDFAYCEKAVIRSRAESGMDEEFVAFTDYVQAAINALAKIENEDDEDNVDASGDGAPGIPISKELIVAGKYAGRTFGDVYGQDPDYCDSVVEHMMKSKDPGSKLWPFVAYTLYRRTKPAS